MFIVMLKMSGAKERAAEKMAEHKAWLQRGFDDGFFLASGNLMDEPGGGILVHGLSKAEVMQLVSEDPFVVDGIVTAHVIGMTPSKVDPRLEFALSGSA